jgi:hypothetical protein
MVAQGNPRPLCPATRTPVADFITGFAERGQPANARVNSAGMISYQRKSIRIAEFWNGEPPGKPRVDLVRFFQQSEPLPGMFCREFYTIVLDLSQSDDVLLAKMKKGTRYEIRRAANEDVIHETWSENDPRLIDEFCEYYDQFAAQKAQPRQNREWLSLLARDDALTISRVRDVSGQTLVWHSYLRAGNRVTLLSSASLFRDHPSSTYRSYLGRANRFHHWQDMLHFKKHLVTTYDFGGWYQKQEDPERLRINQFKEEFGGEIVKTYICERALTLRGKIFLRMRRLVLGDAI